MKTEKMSMGISYEELLFAIYQEIDVNTVEALESYIKKWTRKRVRSIKLHKDNHPKSSTLHFGGVLRENNSNSLSTSSRPFKDFLSKILRSLNCIFRDRKLLYSMSQSSVPPWNRYLADFEEIGLLGRGGFGQVYRVRHRLDGKEYAVKKVPLRFASSAEYCSLLQEVRLLSQMNHSNVAHYYSSWLQLDSFFPPEDSDGIYSSLSDNELTDSSSTYSSLRKTWREKPSKRRETSFSSSRSSIVFRSRSDPFNEAKRSEDGNSLPEPLVQESFPAPLTQSLSRLNLKADDVHSCHQLRSGSYSSLPAVSSLVAHNDATESLVFRYTNISRPLRLPMLFIQMELGSESLLSWIDKRNESVRTKTYVWSKLELLRHFNIFTDILSALEYIHSKGIVHRDVKPANILISAVSNSVLLADFGLATLSLPYELKPSQTLWSKKAQSFSAVGTPPYAAPEMSISSLYDTKVDIYSVGIILFELMCPFTSKFERAKTIERLKIDRKVHSSLMPKWSSLCDVVLTMTDINPRHRPTASNLRQQFRTIYTISSRQINRSSSSSETCPACRSCFSVKQNTQASSRTFIRRSATYPGFSPLGSSVVKTKPKREKPLQRVSFRASRTQFAKSSWLGSLKQKDNEIKLLKQRVTYLKNKIKELEKGS